MPGDIAGAVALYGPAKRLSEKVVLCADGRGARTAEGRGRGRIRNDAAERGAV